MNEFKYVLDHSQYVKVNQDRIIDFVNEAELPKYKHWSTEIDLNLTEKEWILLVFIMESMNFCFWQKPKWKIEYHGDELSGSNALFYAVVKEIENNPNFLNIDYLYELNKDDLYNIFKPKEGEIPLFEERYNNFREVVSYVYNHEDFYNEIYSIKSDLELLKYITNHFKSFDDKSVYKGKIIHFNKRATLLVNDLFYVSSTIQKNLGNVNNLSGCADYGIPRTFRDYGILEYSTELQELVDNEKEILAGSEMEIEIRANMLYVIEIIKEKFNKKGISINSVQLDNLIWSMGKKIKNKKSNVHHTVTIFY